MYVFEGDKIKILKQKNLINFYKLSTINYYMYVLVVSYTYM
jgi:hypothetical protein